MDTLINILSIITGFLGNTRDFKIESEKWWKCSDNKAIKHIIRVRNTGTNTISIKEYGLEIKQYGTIRNLVDVRLEQEEKYGFEFNMNRYHIKFKEAGKPKTIYFYAKTDSKKKKCKIMMDYIDD